MSPLPWKQDQEKIKGPEREQEITENRNKVESGGAEVGRIV